MQFINTTGQNFRAAPLTDQVSALQTRPLCREDAVHKGRCAQGMLCLGGRDAREVPPAAERGTRRERDGASVNKRNIANTDDGCD